MTMPLTYFDISAKMGAYGCLGLRAILAWLIMVLGRWPCTVFKADLYLDVHKGFGMVTFVLAICFGLGF